MRGGLLGFVVAGGVTLVFSSITAWFCYKALGKKDIAVSVVLYSLLIFSIVFFVSFESSIGLGIGLLGILSLIRLRSTEANLIDIGFIFYAITIGLINASLGPDGGFGLLLLVNAVLATTVCVLASDLVFGSTLVETTITFDDLACEQFRDGPALTKIVADRYHLDPVEVHVLAVDYLRDSVTVRVRYRS